MKPVWNNYPSSTNILKDFKYYRGEITEGIPNGKGEIIFPNGEKYEGEWVQGVI